MTTEEIRELIAGIGVKTAELAELQKRTEEELRQSSLETRRMQQETDRQITRLGQQLGGLGEKFGGFTEGMAFPSMRKLLGERFHMDVISLRDLSRKNGHSMELDVLAYSKSPEIKDAYIVEVKSHLREDGLQQMKRILRDSREFFPVLADKKVYGVIAAVDFSDDVRTKVLREGIYLARIHDEEFELAVPEDFKPQAF